MAPIFFHVHRIIYGVYGARCQAESYKGGEGQQQNFGLMPIFGKKYTCQNENIFRPM
jgi:hypothetical protein